MHPREYMIPADVVRGPFRDDREAEWARLLAGCDQNGIRNVLIDRWACVESPGVRGLAEMIVSFTPTSIVVWEGLVFLGLLRPHGSPSCDSDRMFVRRRFSTAEARNSLGGFAFDTGTCEELEEFLECFGGLKDSPPGFSGEWVAPDQLFRVRDPLYYFDLGEASNSLLFYSSCTRDVLGLCPDGSSIWFCPDDLEAGYPPTRFAGSVDETIAKYVSHHLERGGEPFTSEANLGC